MIYAIIIWLLLGAYWIQSGKFLIKEMSAIDLLIVTPVIILFLFVTGIILIFANIYAWVFGK